MSLQHCQRKSEKHQDTMRSASDQIYYQNPSTTPVNTLSVRYSTQYAYEQDFYTKVLKGRDIGILCNYHQQML